ncbi:MAG TPA: hypothetical protein VF510_13520 [Ktedonobacterales bacterium]
MWTVEVRPAQGKNETGRVRCMIVDEQHHEVARTAGGYENDEELRLARTLAAAPELLAACRIALQALEARSNPDLAIVKGILNTALKQAAAAR